jgi:Fe-S-cluster-containing hydrogenase component 2
VLEGAYKLGIIQDVYSLEDDSIRGFSKSAEECGECRRCEDFCPTHLTAEEIGVKTGEEDCIQCLYCWWVCPKGALHLDGELKHMERQVERYKSAVEAL